MWRHSAAFSNLKTVNLTESNNYFSYRTIKTGRHLPINPSRCIVDGDLIWLYLSLPVNEKQEVAKKIGTRMEEIITDLMEIENVSSVF